VSEPAILYDKPECPFCWRVRMALHRCGVEVERRPYDRWEHEWRALTPQATVPVLRMEGRVMTDSSQMLDALDDRFGGLWPASPQRRAWARDLAQYADGEVGRAVRDIVFQRRERAPAEWDESVIAAALRAWHEALPHLETALGEREYFVDGAGITDFVLASRFGLAMAYGMPATRLPALAAWFGRISGGAAFLTTAPPVVIDGLQRGWHS